MDRFQGVYPAIITPFKNDELNLDALERFLNVLKDRNINGIVVNGTTGEAPLLDSNERIELIKKCREVLGANMILIAGTGALSTREAIKFSNDAYNAGADVLLITPPYYFKYGVNAQIEYYKDISKSIQIPIILYNIPQMIGYYIDLTTIDKLVDGEKFIGVKDSSGDLQYHLDVIDLIKDRGIVFCGFDTLIPYSLLNGAKGIIAASGNLIPDKLSKIYKLILNGELKKAMTIYRRVYDILRACTMFGVVAVKKLLNKAGFNVGEPRKPLDIGYRDPNIDRYMDMIDLSILDIR